jgi:hypothetical protein
VIWLAWRQFRGQAAVGAAALLVVAVVGVTSRARLDGLYASSGIAGCARHADCAARASSFLNQVNGSVLNHLPLLLGTVLVAVPAVIGMFWGAPVISSELETGTYRLAWSQSVTRSRWLTVKVGLIGLFSLATVAAFSLMVTWSADPIDQVSMGRILPATFSERGLAPVGYAAFGVAFAVAAGTLTRRTIPTMGLTLAVLTVAEVAARWIRPHLIPPVSALLAITPSDINGIGIRMLRSGTGVLTVTGTTSNTARWVLATQTVNAAHQPVTGIPLTATGPLSVQSCALSRALSCLPYIARRGYRELVTYQPAGRFWAFQLRETVIFLALALAVTAFSFWRIRHLS